MHTRRSTRLYPKFCAESPSTPASRLLRARPARSSHPLLLPLTANATGQSRPDPAGQRSQRGGPERLGLGGAGVLYGAPVACPSAGREVRRAVLCCHSPPRALRGRLAVGVRSRVGPPQSPHAGAQSSGLPRVCADPGPAAASPSPAPAPFPARLPARPPAAATRAHVPARAAPGWAAPRRPLGGSEKEGTGLGGSGGSWSAADRAPPAAGEGAGRVSVGRETETAAGARPPPPLEPPPSRPRTLAGETRG